MSRIFWKKAKMVSEIPRVRQNEVKNILETGIDVPKRGTIKPRRRDARLIWGDVSPEISGSMELV